MASPVFTIENELWCECTKCGQKNPLKYQAEVGLQKYICHCVKCATHPQALYDDIKIECVICGEQGILEFLDGIDFINQPNSPGMQKVTCSMKCLQILRLNFTNTIDPPNLHRRCAGCGDLALQKCTRCKITYYCTRACQRAHWKQHKLVCVQ